jgi:hypothetical protein
LDVLFRKVPHLSQNIEASLRPTTQVIYCRGFINVDSFSGVSSFPV